MTRRFLAFCILTACAFLLIPTSPAAAQVEIPEGLPEDADPAAGVHIFRQRCATCHGETGLGDGQMAAQLPNLPAPIGSEDYLAEADLPAMFATIQNGRVEAGMPGFGLGNNSDPLSPEAIWDVLAGLFQLRLLNQPLPVAVVSGQVANGTTGEPAGNLTAVLQAFDNQFTEALRLEAPVSAGGDFRFDLQLVPPNWVYRVIVNYEGIDFTSTMSTFDPFDPRLEMPVTLYEATTDDGGLRFSQLQVIVDFVSGLAQFGEFYLVSNEENAVFIGRDGLVDNGTIELTLPDNAAGVRVMRGFGGPTDFVPFPAEGIIRDGSTLRLKVPVRPGSGSLRLLLLYELPFTRGLTINRSFTYPVDQVQAIMSEAGVTIDTQAGWELLTGSLGATAAESRAHYVHGPVPRGGSLTVSLAGWPAYVTDDQGNRIVNRDEQAELLIGAAALLLVSAAVFAIGYRWRTRPAAEGDRDQLLHELAALEALHEEGKIRAGVYRQRRQQLIERLTEIWEG